MNLNTIQRNSRRKNRGSPAKHFQIKPRLNVKRFYNQCSIAAISQGEESVYAEGLHCGWVKGKPGEAWYGNPTAFSFCLALSSFFSCTLCLPDSVSIGWVQPVTTWHFKGQASKAGTSILSICDFTLWLLITLLHSI